jgi:two-component system sensor histidine kinase KdpD
VTVARRVLPHDPLGAYPHVGSAVVVVAAGLIVWGLWRLTEVPHVSIVFLCAVFVSAARWGRGPGLFAAALSIAAACFFFYPPIYSFGVDSRRDHLDLAVFSIAAVVVSTLADEVRRRRIDAEHHDAMTAELYAFSRRMAGIAELDPLLRAIVEIVSSATRRPTVLALSTGGALVASGGVAPDDAVAEAVRAAAGDAAAPDVAGLPESGWRIRRLRRGDDCIGALALAGGPLDPDREELVATMTDQAAIAIERAQLATVIADARARAHTEKLREALLNAVSHDFRTPLAAIIGSATSLQSSGAAADRPAESELLATIREEAERLHHWVGNVLDLSRIRAGQVVPRLEIVEVADIVNAALRRVERELAAHEIDVDLPPDLPMACLDLFLTEQALVHLLENAAKYSPPSSRIAVTARHVNGELALVVRDQGVGIAPEDQARVFERFYRVDLDARTAAGTGLGLAICRAFVEAQRGRVEVFSAGTDAGASFSMLFPLDHDAAGEAELSDE